MNITGGSTLTNSIILEADGSASSAYGIILGADGSASSVCSIPQNEIPFSKPFGSLNKLDCSIVDIFTQTTFGELIYDSFEKDLPFYIICIEDSLNNKTVLDATSFIFSYFANGQKTSPTNREKIVRGKVYEVIKATEPVFMSFCNMQSLEKNFGHYAKHINSTSDLLTRSQRAVERYYIGHYYEKLIKPQDIKKAYFWYNKAIEDGSGDAHFALARWYIDGNEVVPKNMRMFECHIILAAKKTDSNVSTSEGLNSLAKKILEKSPELKDWAERDCKLAPPRPSIPRPKFELRSNYGILDPKSPQRLEAVEIIENDETLDEVTFLR